MSLWAVLIGLVSGAVSMALYARLSPQIALKALKEEQRTSRSALKAHEDDWDTLKTLITADLKLSLTQIKLMLKPFVFSMLPVVAIAVPFELIISAHVLEYVLAIVFSSLAAKFLFKII